MPIALNGQKFYRTSEVCTKAGISRMTLLRWIRDGSFTDVEQRDWRGWRLFTDSDLTRLKDKVNSIQRIKSAEMKIIE